MKKEVKKMLKKLPRCKLGILEFDKLCSGGFVKNSVNSVFGDTGTGRTIFATQFLIEGLEKREKVMYVNFSMNKEKFFENVFTLGWDLEKKEKSGHFFFLHSSPEKLKLMLDEGGGTIESLIFKHGITRLVIDSLSEVTATLESDQLKSNIITNLMDTLKKWDCTTLLTVRQNPDLVQSFDSSLIGYEADSVTYLYTRKDKGKRKTCLEILKMRATKHSKEMYFYEIGQKGMNLDKKCSDED